MHDYEQEQMEGQIPENPISIWFRETWDKIKQKVLSKRLKAKKEKPLIINKLNLGLKISEIKDAKLRPKVL